MAPYGTFAPIVLPTKERLQRIALADTANCSHCGQIDTISHRLIECGAEKEMWNWTQEHLATMLHNNSSCIPNDWPLRPCFSFWPPQKHGAVLWILAYFVYYRVQYPTMTNLQDFADFMRRARWKVHPLPLRCKRVGDYLTVLETSHPPRCLWASTYPRVLVAMKNPSPHKQRKNLNYKKTNPCVSYQTYVWWETHQLSLNNRQ